MTPTPVPDAPEISLRCISGRADRACVGVAPEVFFPRTMTPAAVDYAKAHCRRCPVLGPCLTYAMANDADGIWGGTTAAERLEMQSDGPVGLESAQEQGVAVEEVVGRSDPTAEMETDMSDEPQEWRQFAWYLGAGESAVDLHSNGEFHSIGTPWRQNGAGDDKHAARLR